ncbi:MAG: zf-HC2 domain-containing protein [Gammaproteobacteria bacterium]|nr:zf-HC2 domain-containing protein [Gammaproteobacteria bacterium]
MDCRTFNAYLDDLIDGALDAAYAAELESHAGACAHCDQRLARARRLRVALRELPSPEPPVGFADRALQTAAIRAQGARRRARTTAAGFALAASLCLGVAIGVLMDGRPEPGPAGRLQQVSISVSQPQQIRLAFDTEQALPGATLTVRLPAGVELVGFPGRRELSWRTDLAAGTNLLNLPVVARGTEGGKLVTRLSHGERSRTFTVRIRVHQANGQASGPGRGPVGA